MKTRMMIGVAAAMLVAGGAAVAQDMRAPAGDMTRAQAQSRAEAMFDMMDANHDGKLDAADREARMAAMFDRMDTDHNGQLSRAEFLAFHAAHRMGEGMGADHGRPGRGGMMGRMADADANGSLTRSEVVNAALARFDKADANHDGKLTVQERQAQRGKWRGRGSDEPPADDMDPPHEGHQ